MRQAIPFGKYLLLDRISVGGMAEVFKAKSYGVEGFEKVIAIKRILPSMGEDRDFIKMFIDEAKIVGQLAHANICQIFELGRTDGAHFIAMEYIWGKDLLQVQNRLRKLKLMMPPAMACFVVAKVCEGLDYAHKKRDALGRPLEIVHRDCSPQNVLISYEGEVKLIDFGIAKAASRSSRTQAGVLKGKFGYMSPEQVRGLPLDRRSDLFSVGTILYECLTGDRLFVGETDFSTLEKVRNVDVPRPRQVNPAIPEAVEAIIMKALAKDADARYQWASEMVGDLQAFLMTQEQVFTAKSLAAWLKESFAADLERERQQLEAFKKLGREGLIAGKPQAEARLDVVEHLGAAGAPEGDPTTLGGPSFTDDEGSTINTGGGAPPAAQRDHAADFGEEQRTEIFGEIGDAPRAGAQASRPGARPGGPPVTARAEDPTIAPLGLQDASLEAALAIARAQVVARQAPPPAPAPGAVSASQPAVPPPPPSSPPMRTSLGMTAPSPPAQPAMAGPPPQPGSGGMPMPTLMGGMAPVRPVPPRPSIPPPPRGMAANPPPAYGAAPPAPPAAGGYGPGFGQPGYPPAGGPAAPGGPGGMGNYGPVPGQPGVFAPMPSYAGQPGYGGQPPAGYGGQPPAGYGGQPPPGYGGPPLGAAGPPGGFAPTPSYGGRGPHASQPPGAFAPTPSYAGQPGFGGAPPQNPMGYYVPQLGLYGPSAAPVAAAPVAPVGKRRSSLMKDVLIGVAIAGVVLGGFAVVKFVVLADKGETTAASATGSLEIKLADSGSAEVFVDGTSRGMAIDGKLVLADLAAASHAVKVTRTGATPCEGSVDVTGGETATFPCTLAAAAPPPVDAALVAEALDAGTDDGGVLVAAAEIDAGVAEGTQVAAVEPGAPGAGSGSAPGAGSASGSAGSASADGAGAGTGSAPADAAKVAAVDPATIRPAAPATPPKPSVSEPRTTTEPKPRTTTEPKPRTTTTTEPKPRTTTATEPRPARTEPKPTRPEATVPAGADGYLIASTTPWAQVAIDGVPTGKMTPITMQGKIALKPGPHKLTFTVGRDKFHFTVKIEPGKTTRFTKDLQVQNPAADE